MSRHPLDISLPDQSSEWVSYHDVQTGDVYPGSGSLQVDPLLSQDDLRSRLAKNVMSRKRVEAYRGIPIRRRAEPFQSTVSPQTEISESNEAPVSTWELDSDIFGSRHDCSFGRPGRRSNENYRYSISMPLEDRNSLPPIQVEDYLSLTAFLAPFSVTHAVLPEGLNENILGEGLTFRVSECVLPTECLQTSGLPKELGSKRLVALKRVKASAFMAGSFLKKILQDVCLELRVLLHFPLRKHANIIDIIAIGWESRIGPGGLKSPSPLLIVEHATHGNLQDYQNTHHLSWEEKRSLSLDIALALQVLHDCGIVHGDMKSENVLLFHNDERKVIAKLSDFGCSLVDNDNEYEGEGGRVLLGGTPMWAAPEIMHGPVPWELATLTDVYSFGLLVWRLCIDGHNPLTSSMIFAIEIESGEDCDQLLHQIHNRKEQERFLSICIEHGQLEEQKSMNSIPLVQIMETTLPTNPRLRGDMTAVVPLLLQNKMVRARNNEGTLHEGQKPTRSPGLFAADFVGEKHKDILDCMFFHDQYTQTQQTLPIGVTSEIVSGLLRIASLGQTRKCPHCVRPTVLDGALSNVTFDDLVDLRDELYCGALGGGDVKEYPLVRSAEAAFELCYCFTVGYGVQASEEEALKWLVFAASNGVERAQAMVRPLYDSFGRAIPEELPHMTWLYKGIIAGSAEASRYLMMINPDFYLLAREVLMRCYRGIGRDFWKDHNPNGSWPIDNLEQLGETIRAFGVPIDELLANWHYEDRLLHLAAAAEFPETIQFLLTSLGADVNVTNQTGETPLLSACRSGRIRTARMLIEQGAEVTASTDTGVTALHWLISFTRQEEASEIALSLYSGGANLGATSSPQRLTYESPTQLYYCGTALHWAVTSRNVGATRVLVDLGADPNLRNTSGKTPLELAVALHFREGVQLLLPLFIGSSPVDLVRIGIRHVSPFFHRAQFGSRWMKETSDTILMITLAVAETDIGQLVAAIPQLLEDAIQRWPTFLVDNLLDAFISLSIVPEPTRLLERPLGLLIEDDNLFCFERSLRKCIDHFHFDPKNLFLISVAASTNNSHYMSRLLKLGADPFELTEEGLDAFGMAILNSNFSTALAVLNHSSSVAQRSHFEAYGPDIFGAEHGPATLLGRLLSMPQIDADPIAHLFRDHAKAVTFVVCPKSNATALHVISHALESFHRPISVKRYRRVLSMLLEHYRGGHHLNALDSYCRSPLYWAVEAINFEAVNALLTAGADPNVGELGTTTALDVSYSILSEQMLGNSSKHRITERFLEFGNEGRRFLKKRLNEIIDLLRVYGGKTGAEMGDRVISPTPNLGSWLNDETLDRDDFEALVKTESDVDAMSFVNNTPLWEARVRRSFPD